MRWIKCVHGDTFDIVGAFFFGAHWTLVFICRLAAIAAVVVIPKHFHICGFITTNDMQT